MPAPAPCGVSSSSLSGWASEYTVLAKPWGVATSAAARLTVAAVGPWFLSQPQSRTGFPGQSLAFSPVARGTEPLSYQWQCNGKNLLAATNPTLTFPSVHGSDAGAYRVVVSNEFGAATSAVATVTIATPRPLIGCESLGAGGLSLSFHAYRGATYILEYKEHLEDLQWLELARRAGDDATFLVTDSAQSGRNRFYRIRVE